LLFTNLGSEGEICTGGKWRIDVDKVDLTRKLFEQRPHYEQVVTPYELVPPFCLARGLGLVEDFCHLKGQVGPRQLS
jgi:hypothetical protein